MRVVVAVMFCVLLFSCLIIWRTAAGPDAPEAETDNAAVVSPAESQPPLRVASLPKLPPLADAPPSSASDAIGEAEQVMAHLAGRFPSNPDAHEVSARFSLWRGDTSSAVEAWRRSLAIEPGYAHAYDGLASVAAEKGDHAAAAELYGKSLEIHRGSASSAIGRARALAALQQTEEAVELLQQTAKSFPDDADTWYELGLAQQQAGDYEDAAQSLENALRLLPQYAAAHIALANAYTRLGRKEDSRRHHKKYEELRTAELEQTRRANLEYDDDAAARGEVARLYVDAGRVYLAEGDPAAAERIWRRCSEIDSRNVDCRQALAWLSLQQNRPEQTIRMLRELAALEPKSVGYPIEIARLLAESGRVEEAEQTLQNARSETAPQSPAAGEVSAALAKLYLGNESRREEALSLAREAVELSPTADNFALLSSVFEAGGRWSDAAEAMSEAVRLAPANVSYRQRLKRQQQPAAQLPNRADDP